MGLWMRGDPNYLPTRVILPAVFGGRELPHAKEMERWEAFNSFRRFSLVWRKLFWGCTCWTVAVSPMKANLYVPENERLDTQDDDSEKMDSLEIWPFLGIYVRFLGCSSVLRRRKAIKNFWHTFPCRLQLGKENFTSVVPQPWKLKKKHVPNHHPIGNCVTICVCFWFSNYYLLFIPIWEKDSIWLQSYFSNGLNWNSTTQLKFCFLYKKAIPLPKGVITPALNENMFHVIPLVTTELQLRALRQVMRQVPFCGLVPWGWSTPPRRNHLTFFHPYSGIWWMIMAKMCVKSTNYRLHAFVGMFFFR